MTERAYWIDHVRPCLAPFGKMARVENALELGTPDVAYCLRRRTEDRAASGWIELKYLPQLPARASSPVVLDKLTLDQVRFAEEWTAAGGLSFLLLRADDHHILTDAATARALYDRKLTAPGLVRRALVSSTGAFPAGRVLAWLTRRT